MGGTLAWGLGELLATPHIKNWHCYEVEFTICNTKLLVCISQRTLCFCSRDSFGHCSN
jgi:hypothetical protein